MEDFIGQTFQIELAEGGACLGFKGKLLKIEGDFALFETMNGKLLVNYHFIRTMMPRGECA